MFSKARQKARKAPVPPSLLGTDLTVTGDVVAEGEVQIDGTIDGDVRCARLIVGVSGRIRGQIRTDGALIRGSVEGNIEAKQVTLTRTARVVGDIQHETLTIEPGAHLDGRCEHRETVARPGEARFNLVVNDGVPAGGRERG